MERIATKYVSWVLGRHCGVQNSAHAHCHAGNQPHVNTVPLDAIHASSPRLVLASATLSIVQCITCVSPGGSPLSPVPLAADRGMLCALRFELASQHSS